MKRKGEEEAALAGKRRRYLRLARRLARTGLVLQGTITELRPPRPGPRRAGEPATYGPYYQWTWKEGGKTVTRRLTSEQARLFQKAITNQRRLEETLREMRRLSREMLDASTQGVRQRKARKK
jgi:hypothetical protein